MLGHHICSFLHLEVLTPASSAEYVGLELWHGTAKELKTVLIKYHCSMTEFVL